jgi:hypothetical protein
MTRHDEQTAKLEPALLCLKQYITENKLATKLIPFNLYNSVVCII